MTANAQAIDDCIARWEPSGGGERSNCQMFLAELCRLLDVAEPEPAVEDESRNAYIFERKVPARRSYHVETDASRHVTFVPIRYRNDPSYILALRHSYQLWHHGLIAVREHFFQEPLRSIDIIGPAAPAEPWSPKAVSLKSLDTAQAS